MDVAACIVLVKSLHLRSAGRIDSFVVHMYVVQHVKVWVQDFAFVKCNFQERDIREITML